MIAKYDAAVRRAVDPDVYRGLSRKACDEIAAALCAAAIRTGCFKFLAGHLNALAYAGRWDE